MPAFAHAQGVSGGDARHSGERVVFASWSPGVDGDRALMVLCAKVGDWGTVVSSHTSAGITVRPATSADMPALGRLGALLVSLHHGFDPDRFIAATPNTEGAYTAFLTAELDRTTVIVLVAEGAGEVLGYTYAGIEGNDYMALRGPAGVLYDLVVDPARRREGIGRRLLEATLADLVARGAPRLVVSTAERNVAAQRLFASVGFRRTMIEMTRDLDGR